ncbi:alkaline phosphatase family protein [Streptomyces beihaiensis]|uniref:phospholipase C n=1 Tax=Streptomyces beihaiensis TaxID=2984495 RepID=A0ABT3U0G0_9ACTN|nr:alkaline phosphatase family protein [Streptomyces beihaiensis]MCX3062801.1 alkaline phosphatase family protein [Streptomyces beihaiensis]
MTGKTLLSRTRGRLLSSAAAVAAAALGGWLALSAGVPAHAATGLPTPDHTIVVVFENHSYGQIIGSSRAPYINSLADGGANLTASYAQTHPSQPNYYALFSGDTQGVTDDSCVAPGFSSADNLGAELLAAGKSWASYNEDLPSQGSTVCSSGNYAQKHNPWFGFGNVPTSTAKTFAQFPTDYSTLPKVSYVIPNLCSDMHNCSVKTGDRWIKNNLGDYATWAKSHNSLLVITFDEDNGSSGNHVPTVLYGGPVAAGSMSSATYHHYDVLRTIEDMYGLPYAGHAASGKDITGVWAP